MYQNGDHVPHFGQIKFFLLATQPMAILEEFEQTSIGILHDINIPLPSNFLDKVIYRVKKLSLSSKLNAIPVHSIMTKCVLIPMKGEEYNYIITQPNTYEHH